MSKAYNYKIVLCGNGAVSKTSLIRRFVHKKYEEEYVMTLGSDITKYTEEIEGDKVSLILWDLAGQAGFKTIREGFFNGANAAIIVFSHEESEAGEKSFQKIPEWLKEIAEQRGKIPSILLGNKIDLVDSSKLNSDTSLPKSDSNINKLVSDLGFIGYYKTSALSGENVPEAFRALIYELYKKDKSVFDAIQKGT